MMRALAVFTVVSSSLRAATPSDLELRLYENPALKSAAKAFYKISRPELDLEGDREARRRWKAEIKDTLYALSADVERLPDISALEESFDKTKSGIDTVERRFRKLEAALITMTVEESMPEATAVRALRTLIEMYLIAGRTSGSPWARGGKMQELSFVSFIGSLAVAMATMVFDQQVHVSTYIAAGAGVASLMSIIFYVCQIGGVKDAYIPNFVRRWENKRAGGRALRTISRASSHNPFSVLEIGARPDTRTPSGAAFLRQILHLSGQKFPELFRQVACERALAPSQ